MIKISVIMGVYREKNEYIKLAIDSILNQSFTNFEFIIVLDDPNNIEGLKLLNEYKEKDSRIKVIVNERNIGLAMSLNKAIELAKGEYLARMDADDISLPDRFIKQVEYMDAHPEIAVVGTNKNIIDESGKQMSKGGHLPEKPKDTEKCLKYANIIVHPSVMMRLKNIKAIGGYRDFPTTQDLDLWLRVLSAEHKICNMDEYLINYRINSQSISMSKAYLQAIVGKYIRKMEKERKKNNTDSYSKEGLLQFLKENKYDDNKTIERYNVAKMKLENGRISIKKKHLISGVASLIHASLMHPIIMDSVKKMIFLFVYKKYTLKSKT